MRLRFRTIGVLAGAVGLAVAVARHGHAVAGRTAPGGTLIRNAVVYDALSRLLLGSFFRRIAANIAAAVPNDARVLEVGCGPGQLSIELARHHGLDVTGVDLDPAMIERARLNAQRTMNGDERPAFLVGDVASLAFPDRSFDLVVSTLSMHHWTDPSAGLVEIGRVLRPGARALIWDFRPGHRPHFLGPRHIHISDPMEHMPNSSLRMVGAIPWPGPFGFNLVQRIELIRTGE